MNNFSKHIGQRIRMYRKLKGMTLEQLAFQIHKSRASLCKYENGQIILDVNTRAMKKMQSIQFRQ